MFTENIKIWNFYYITFVRFRFCETNYVVFINKVDEVGRLELWRQTTHINTNQFYIGGVWRCERVTIVTCIVYITIVRSLSLVVLHIALRCRNTRFWVCGAAPCGLLFTFWVRLVRGLSWVGENLHTVYVKFVSNHYSFFTLSFGLFVLGI